MNTLKAGATIGILGGGQLGRMLAGAASQLGFDTHILCPEPRCPAGRVAAKHTVLPYEDSNELQAWANECDVITYEFENVPVSVAEGLIAKGHTVRPGAKALEVSQDRVLEKYFLQNCEIATAEFAAIDAADEIAEPLVQFGGQGILKTRRDGYDGKGQVRVETGDDLEAAHKALGNRPAILEALVPFEREISVIIARDTMGTTLCYDIPRNEHVNGILRRSVVPSGVSTEVVVAACEGAERLAHALDYVGVLALEYFVLADGSLMANEFAPRVHNSGHWTPEACATSQFEQHIRAIAGWPLGPVTRFHDTEMLNLLGEDTLVDPSVLAADGVLTLYGKREAKPGRKMGHLVRRRGPAR